MRPVMHLVLLLTAILLCASCSWLSSGDGDNSEEKRKQEELEKLSEKQFYDRIQRNLQSGNWTDAIANLQAFEAQFPFGNYAEQAQLELIYAYYASLDYEAAIAAADRFIRLHPRHPNVDYAYYVKGLSSLRQSKGIFTNFMPTDASRRDQGEARTAFATFSELLSRYPNSTYAADARKRMLHLRDLLARHEIHVANYYFLRGAYLAAANRGRYVVENFQQTPAVPDGLAVMAQAYYFLGLRDLAEDSARVLAANYSDHPALDDEGRFQFMETIGEDEDHWLSRVTLGLYQPEKPPKFDSRAIYNPIDRALAEPKEPDLPQPEGTEPAKRSWLNRLSFGLLG